MFNVNVGKWSHEKHAVTSEINNSKNLIQGKKVLNSDLAQT